jgi:hypothetical protein
MRREGSQKTRRKQDVMRCINVYALGIDSLPETRGSYHVTIPSKTP